jgi:hypothetical protein
VTVVEWGEGLVEDLAPDHLQISIDRGSAAGPGWTSGPGSNSGPGSAGGPGSNSGPGPAGGLSDDELRLVTVTGHGDRWRIAAAALRAALAEPVNPLV